MLRSFLFVRQMPACRLTAVAQTLFPKPHLLVKPSSHRFKSTSTKLSKQITKELKSSKDSKTVFSVFRRNQNQMSKTNISVALNKLAALAQQQRDLRYIKAHPDFKALLNKLCETINFYDTNVLARCLSALARLRYQDTDETNVIATLTHRLGNIHVVRFRQDQVALVLSVWSLAQLQPPKDTVEPIFRELVSNADLSHWDHRDLANIIWAYGHTGMQPHASFLPILERCIEISDTFHPLSIASTLSAVVKLDLQKDLVEPLFRALVQNQDFSEWDARAYSSVLAAHAKVQMKLDSFFVESFRQHCLASPEEFHEKDISLALWALAKLRTPKHVTELLFRILVSNADMSKWSPENLSKIIWAHAHAGVMVRSAILPLLQRCLEIPDEFNEIQVSTTLLAVVKLKFPPQVVELVFRSLLYERDLSNWNPQCLSNVMWAHATSGVAPSADFLEGFERRCLQISGKFLGQHVGNILWAIAKLDLVEQCDGLRNVVRVLMEFANVAKFTDQGFANTVWALGRTKTVPEMFVLRELISRAMSTWKRLPIQALNQLVVGLSGLRSLVEKDSDVFLNISSFLRLVKRSRKKGRMSLQVR